MAFDEESASPEELWAHYMGKYNNPNPIARKLTSGFFDALSALVSQLPAACSLLEVGCGPGESTRRLLAMLNVRALEASEYEQRLVDLHHRQGFPVPLRQESVYQLDRQDDEFDCILLLEVLEHLDDYETALAEIFRVASKHVIISVPNEPLWRILNFVRGKYWSDWGNTPGHVNHWSPAAFTALLNRYGKVVKRSCPLPWTILLVEVDGRD